MIVSALRNTTILLKEYGSWEFIDSLNDQSIAASDVGL